MKQFLCVVLGLGLAATVRAQTNVDWLTIDGGGSFAASANYLVNDTVGQADAATWSSVNYTIVGGFWALQNLGPSTGLPELHIAVASPGNVLLWWPSPSTGFVLQENTNITNAAGWSDVAAVVNDNGFIRSLTRPSPGTNRFYRLRHP